MQCNKIFGKDVIFNFKTLKPVSFLIDISFSFVGPQYRGVF